MNNMDLRQEHIESCKALAIELINKSEITEASELLDLLREEMNKLESTKNHIAIELMDLLVSKGVLSSKNDLIEYIEKIGRVQVCNSN